jgi:hypothetical protein
VRRATRGRTWGGRRWVAVAPGGGGHGGKRAYEEGSAGTIADVYGPFSHVVFGGDLLSHTLTSAVPSALQGLATGFGKGPGVPPTQ